VVFETRLACARPSYMPAEASNKNVKGEVINLQGVLLASRERRPRLRRFTSPRKLEGLQQPGRRNSTPTWRLASTFNGLVGAYRHSSTECLFGYSSRVCMRPRRRMIVGRPNCPYVVSIFVSSQSGSWLVSLASSATGRRSSLRSVSNARRLIRPSVMCRIKYEVFVG
jgi:hypothetical protein